MPRQTPRAFATLVVGAIAALATLSSLPVTLAADELFVSNYGTNTITVYARTANGSVAPARTIRTGLDHPHTLGVDRLHRELFVANNLTAANGPAVNVYDLDASDPGNDLPKRTITGPLTGLNRPAGLAVDPVHQELYVANDLDSGSSITVFALGANGNVAPLRTLQGPLTGIEGPIGIALDLAHDEVFIASYKVVGDGSITVFPRTADGNVSPLRTIQGPLTGFNRPQSLAVDLARDEIIVANSYFSTNLPGNLLVFPRLASGDVGPTRQIAGESTLLCNPIGLALDLVNDEIVVTNSHAGDDACASSVTTYARTASGDAAPLRQVGPGSVSALSNPEGVAVITRVDCSDPLVANGTLCDDGNVCTQTDTCQDGLCTGSDPVACIASDPCHVAGSCDAATGCSNPKKPDGATCDDGNACTQTDTCQTGVCAGGNPVVCTAADLCHAPGACDAATGVCSIGSPVVCAASDQCHDAGVCDPAAGCPNPPKADGVPCNDGNSCTQPDRCQAGACAGGNPVCAAEELFVSNYSANTIAVYVRGANGDVAPERTIQTGLDHPHTLGVDLLHRELFVPNNLPASAVPAVNVYDLNASFPGTDQPKRTIAGPLTGLNKPAGIAVDSVHQELYVSNDLDSGSSIRVYALGAAGNVAPLRVLQGPLTGIEGPIGIALDLVHDEVFIASYKVADSGSIAVFPRTASGDVAPDRIIQGPLTGLNQPQGLVLDLGRDELVVANSFFLTPLPGSLAVFRRTDSGDVGPIRQYSGPSTALCHPIGLVLDPANGELVVANSSFDDATCDQSVTAYPRAAAGDVSPIRQIGPGPASALSGPASVVVTARVDCADPSVADGTPCDDGNACTHTDICQAGVCAGGAPPVCAAPDPCHTAGTCDPATGACVNPAAPDGTACNDDKPCTSDDVCTGGACAGTPIDVPPETQGLSVAADKATYSWSAAAFATQYDVVRGGTNAPFAGPGGGNGTCFGNLTEPVLVDSALPEPGAGFWYLSRAGNACGTGSFGNESNGLPRAMSVCP